MNFHARTIWLYRLDTTKRALDAELARLQGSLVEDVAALEAAGEDPSEWLRLADVLTEARRVLQAVES